MHILTFSSLFPNSVDPTHGIFVARRLSHLLEGGDISATVVAPVPWFPSRATVFGRWAEMAAIEPSREDSSYSVFYPRYPVIPKIGMRLAARLMARFCLPIMRRLAETHGPFDLIDAHYFYPDGVAAAAIAKELRLPYVVTARGSDVNLIADFAGPRRQMLQAASGAGRVIAVSEALAERMREIGMRKDKIAVVRNGVDMDFFTPGNRAEAQRRLGLGDQVMVYIGALKSAKGQRHAIRLLADCPEAQLVIIGKGPEEQRYRRLAKQCGVTRRVRFAGNLPPEDVREYYRAATATLLLSEREGMPNVVLESLACGTQVLGSRAGGIPELIREPVAGCLVREPESAELLDAWNRIRTSGSGSDAVRKYAESYTWDDSIRRLSTILGETVSGGGVPRAVA